MSKPNQKKPGTTARNPLDYYTLTIKYYIMFKKLKTISVLLLLVLGGGGANYAVAANDASAKSVAPQNGAATGVVYDSNGETVIGASVIVKGTQKGTATDFDGNFSIAGVQNGATLVISYVGCVTQEVKWTGSPLKVTLKDDNQVLQEVVVTGYGGKRSRAKLTNSISKVDSETLTAGVHSNPAQALSGAVSGLRVTQTSGDPGATPSMVLRGGTNLDGSGSPLVMVDGQLRSSLSDINPEDIESIEVLKDAGATALYGARASNGVILVTTKTGKKGRAEINLKARVGINKAVLPAEFCGAEEYISWIRRGYMAADWAPKGNLSGATPFGTGNNIELASCNWNVMGYDPKWDYLLGKGWQKMEDPVNPGQYLIYRDLDPSSFNIRNNALTQDYNVNISGGNDRGSYYAGFGYNKSEGLPTQSFYERYSMVFNGSYQITDWLKSITNFNYNRANWDPMPGSQLIGDATLSEANYFGRVLSIPHTARWMDEDGNLKLGANATDGNQAYQPDKFIEDRQSDKFTMIQKFEVTLPAGFKLTATGNWYYDETHQEAFNKDYQTNQAGSLNKTRSSYAYFNRNFSQTYNAVLSWAKDFDKHSVDAMVGLEYYDIKKKGFDAYGYGAPTDDFADLSLTLTDEKARDIDSWHSEQRIMSYFGRANYDYEGKYLASFVFRYDGYSSLLNNRWGFFPGVSAGWVFSKEGFMKDALPVMDFGKLRASYGINGNASGIGAYDLQGSYGTAKYNGNVGYLIGGLPNPNLRWEKTNTFEVGLDMSFFQHRLNANLTYYNRITTDKYASFNLPPSTGFSSITNNNGKFRNQGIEIELSADVVKVGDFKWNSKANITYNKNKVVQLPDNGNELNRQGGIQIYSGRKNADGTDELIWVGGYQEGQEPGAMALYQYEGIFQSEEEINNWYPGGVVYSGHSQNKPQYTPAKWNTLTQAQKNNGILLRPGDAKWKDINGDGCIDKYDLVVVGNSTPHWTGGWTNTFSWKGLQLYVQTDFAFGFKNYDYVTPWYLACGQGTYNMTTEVRNTWTETNTSAKYPRYVYADQLGAASYNRASTLFCYNGAYWAFREVALSYDLPKSIISKAKMQRLQFSITAQNLGYLCAFKSTRPEVSHTVSAQSTSSMASGSGWPLPRTIIFGLNVTF